jgi:hypothetical protein
LDSLEYKKNFQNKNHAYLLREKKNQTLTEVDEDYNKNHSKRRMIVEHTICRIKKYRIMNDVFRNRLRKYDRISDIVSGLLNYRIMNSLG